MRFSYHYHNNHLILLYVHTITGLRLFGFHTFTCLIGLILRGFHANVTTFLFGIEVNTYLI